LPATAIPGRTLRIIGREKEIEEFRRLLEAQDGARTVLLHGNEGVGKTRLLEEIIQSVELDGGWVVHSEGTDGPCASLGVLKRIWHEGRLLEVAEPEPSVPSVILSSGSAGLGAARTRASDFARLASNLLPDLEDERAILLVFDSVENADADSLEFLRALKSRLAGTRALLAIACRSDRIDALRSALGEEDILEMPLPPLDRAQTRAHVDAVLSDAGIAGGVRWKPLDEDVLESFCEWMNPRAGGNPQRILDAIREIAAQGILSRKAEGWAIDLDQLRESAAKDSGPSLPSMELSREDQALLELAAVAGPEFDTRILSALHDDGEEALTGFLARGVRQGILHHGQAGAHSFRISRPEQAREIVQSIPPARRADLHRRIARHLEDAGGEAEAEIARHLESAGETMRARELFIAAGRRERARGALHEATRAFSRAWNLHGQEERSAIPDFAPEWIHALFLDGHVRECARLADDILAQAKSDALAAARGEKIALLKGISLAHLGERKVARQILAGILERRSDMRDPGLEAWALGELAWSMLSDGDVDDAGRTFHQAREIAWPAGELRVLGSAELGLGMLAWRADEIETALEWHTRARDHLNRPGNEDLLPAVWGNLALCHLARLELREAVRLHRRAAEGYARHFRRTEAARSYQNLASALLESGLWTDVEAALRSADQWGRTLRGPREQSQFSYLRASLALSRGLVDEAAAHANIAVTSASAYGDPFVLAGAQTLSAEIDLVRGRRDQARTQAAEALEKSRSCRYRWGIANALWILGQCAKQEGDLDEAWARLDEALRTAEEGRVLTLVFRIELLRAEISGERSDAGGASRILERCENLQSQADSPYWKGLLLQARGRVDSFAERWDDACHDLAGAVEVFTGLGADLRKADSLADLAKARAGLGNHHAARGAWDQVCNLREQLGLPAIPAPFAPVEDSASSLSIVHRVLEIAAAVSREVTQLHSVSRILEKILDSAVSFLGAERGVIALIDPSTGKLVVRHARNMDRDSLPESLDISLGALEHVSKNDGILATGDALADPILGVRESIRRIRIRSLVNVPIRDNDTVIGALYMDHRQQTDLFGEEERLFLQFIAEMAAIGIQNARRYEAAREEAESLRSELEGDSISLPGTVARSPAMRDVLQKARAAAQGNEIVLFTGPTGSGKDHLAQVLHDLSGRKGRFVSCPLPTIAESLVASELFGVARGTATGVEGRIGLVDEAQNGTLFLNEIADVPLPLQASLLHLLDRKEYRPVGSSGPMKKLDALIVCATNADLRRRVEEGSFREDLYFRISERVIEIPALKDRPDDIAYLVEHFLQEESRESKRTITISPEAADLLLRCPWEGNVRELRSCIRSASRTAKSGILEAGDLESPSLRRVRAESEAPPDVLRKVDLVRIQEIREAMNRSGGVVNRACRKLGVSEATLRRWLAKYRLEHLALHRRH
jgi:transcriptional regulator with GAF, ATPase, and Fis domain